MKMKEKKTEEVVEEVVEVNNELLDYLEFARQCMYQYNQIGREVHSGGYFCLEHQDMLLKLLGVNVDKPVDIMAGFNNINRLDALKDLVNNWIEKYNALDLTKCDNYTRTILPYFVPDFRDVEYIKSEISKCASQSEEK